VIRPRTEIARFYQAIKFTHVLMAMFVVGALLGGVAWGLLLTAERETVWFTVDAQSDVVEIDLGERFREPFVVRLPKAALFYEDPDQDFDLVRRELEGVTSLVLFGPSQIMFRSLAAGHISVRGAPLSSDHGTSELRVYDETGLIFETSDPIDLVLDCRALDCSGISGISLPLSASGATIGAAQSEWIEPSGPGTMSYDQLKLNTGQIKAFRSAWVYNTRFELASATLDPGDVLNFRGNRSLVGTLSMSLTDNSSGRLRIVAHTEGDALEIGRFAGGYTFGVPLTTALSQQPFLQTVWLSLVSVIFVLGFLFSSAQFFSSLGGGRATQNTSYQPYNTKE